MSDLRHAINAALDEVAADEPEAIRSFVQEAFALEREKEVWAPVTCKHCRRSGKYVVQVKIPDYRERTKAIALLLDQAKGKPAETKRIEATVDLGLRDMKQLSTEELLVLACEPVEELDAAGELPAVQASRPSSKSYPG